MKITKKEDGVIEVGSSYVDWSLESEEYFDENTGDVEDREYIRINNLFVSPELRGTGLAKKLLSHAIDFITTQHSCEVSEIKIVAEPKESSVEVTKLASFYESFGLDVVCA